MMRTDRTVRSILSRTAIAVVAFGLMWLLGYILQYFLDTQLTALYTKAFTTFVVLTATYVLVWALGYTLTVFEESGLLTPHHREVVYRVFELVAFGLVLVVILIYVWEITLSNALLGAGVTSVVLALAARETLGAVFAGITLISTDVFRVGDWVKIDNRFGQITQISLFNTMVQSPQGETHVFPNDEIVARDITNLGKGRYRNDVLIGVDYGTDIKHVTTICDSILEELTVEGGNNIDGYHPTTVKDFEDSQIEISVKMWVNEPRPMVINRAQTTVFSRLQQQFADEQITIPFPQRTISERETT